MYSLGGRVGRHPARIYSRWDMGKPRGFNLVGATLKGGDYILK